MLTKPAALVQEVTPEVSATQELAYSTPSQPITGSQRKGHMALGSTQSALIQQSSICADALIPRISKREVKRVLIKKILSFNQWRQYLCQDTKTTRIVFFYIH